MVSPRACRVTLALMLGGLLGGCSDDFVDVPDELIGKPYCMIVAGTWGYFADGTQKVVSNGNQAAAGCACVRQEELRSEQNLARLNDLALAACEQAAKQWDFVWHECQQDHESGYWTNSLRYVGDDSDFPNLRPADLHCVDL
jgi:hypothetical protein